MSESIKNMFSSISKNYDLANDVFSFGMHRSWKKKAIKQAEIKANNKILDLATGTGDLALSIKSAYPNSIVTAADFSPKMLEVLEQRSNQENIDLDIIEADALNLPFEDSSFDKCFISYGIRNVDSVEKCLEEIYRVLKPEGRLIILETGKPDGIASLPYLIYSNYVLPVIGFLIAGDSKSYKYLNESAKKFPYGKKLEEFLINAKFLKTRFQKLFFGASYIYSGDK